MCRDIACNDRMGGKFSAGDPFGDAERKEMPENQQLERRLSLIVEERAAAGGPQLTTAIPYAQALCCGGALCWCVRLLGLGRIDFAS